jgi:hypothetical protein
MVGYKMLPILSFDVETSPFNPFASPEFNFVGIYDGQECIFFDTPTQFAKYILSTTRDIVLVAHNLQFDFNMCFSPDYVLPKNYRWRSLVINTQFPHFACIEKSFKVVKKIGHRTVRSSRMVRIWFIDTMNFLKRSLADLMEVFTPQYVKVEDFGLERNINDIKATYHIYKDYFAHFTVRKTKNNKERLFPVMSIASLAFRDLMATSCYKWLNKDKKGRKWRPKWLVKIEQESYHGGIVYPNPRFLGKELENVKYYDINSLYPFIMKHLRVPIKFNGYHYPPSNFGSVDYKQIIRENEKNSDKFYLYRITCDTTQVILPMLNRLTKKLELPIGHVSGWYCHNELVLALPKLSNLKIHQIIEYDAIEGLFASFVDKWYEIKQKSEWGTPEYEYSKLSLNSSYGRLGMRRRRTRFIRDIDKSIIKDDPFLDDERPDIIVLDGEEFNLRWEFGECFIEERLDEEHYAAVTIVASAITAGARGELMKVFNPETDLYMDTDSISTRREIPISDALGGWKIEDQGTMQVFGKKHYIFDGKRKIKGIPKTAKELDSHVYEFQKVLKPREAMIRKLPMFSLVNVIKRLNIHIESDSENGNNK